MEAVVVAGRFLEFSGALVLCGAPLFFLYALGSQNGEVPGMPVRIALLRAAAALSLLGTVIWVMAATASFSGNWRDACAPAALWTVLGDTRFGHAGLIRIALSVASLVALSAFRRTGLLWMVQSLIGIAITATFAWTGHGAMGGDGGPLHLVADLFHLWTAGVWVGALVPLTMMLWSTPDPGAAQAKALAVALARFSRVGIGVVAVLVLSGATNAWFLLGPDYAKALLHDRYGQTLLIKLALFGVMLALAAFNRLRLVPELHAAIGVQRSPARAAGRLKRALILETVVAIAVIMLVSLLGTLPPPAAGD